MSSPLTLIVISDALEAEVENAALRAELEELRRRERATATRSEQIDPGYLARLRAPTLLL